MENVKKTTLILSSKNVLRIGRNTSFKKILKKIFKNKKADAVWLERANSSQMLAVMTSQLIGKKFLWIQSFENPPIPSFLTKLLLNQTDIIYVKNKKLASKLHNFGVDKPKIRIKK